MGARITEGFRNSNWGGGNRNSNWGEGGRNINWRGLYPKDENPENRDRRASLEKLPANELRAKFRASLEQFVDHRYMGDAEKTAAILQMEDANAALRRMEGAGET